MNSDFLRDLENIQSSILNLSNAKDIEICASESDFSIDIKYSKGKIIFESNIKVFTDLLNTAYQKLQIEIAKEQNNSLLETQNLLLKYTKPLQDMQNEATKALNELSKK